MTKSDDKRDHRKFVGWTLFPAIFIFVAAFGLFLAPHLVRINFFDEGLIATGAMQVLNGKIPYRDFYTPYGPAQYYVIAALFAGFGQKLLVLRIAECLLLAAVAVSLFELSRIANRGRSSLSAVVVCVYASFGLYANLFSGYPAVPATFALLLAGFAFGKWSVSPRHGWLVLASALVGMACIWRWDFGAFGVFSLVLASTAMLLRGSVPAKSWLSVGASATLPASTIAIAVYVPLLVVFSDPARWFKEVVVYLFSEFPKWRGVELVRPMAWQMASAWRRGDVVDFSDAVLQLAFAALPGGLAIVTLWLVGRRLLTDKTERFDRATGQSLFLCLITLSLLNQMRVRPDVFHLFPAVVASLPLIPYVVRDVSVPMSIRNPLRALRNIVAFIVGALVFQFASRMWMLAADQRAIAVDTPRAVGIRANPASSYYAKLVNDVRSRTRDRELIYSGALDHSALSVNDPLLYFLADRLPADRFVDLEPGIANTRAGQKEIIRALEDNAVRIVVLLDYQSQESNLSSVTNGIRDLDLFLATHYRRVAQFGPYTVLEAR